LQDKIAQWGAVCLSQTTAIYDVEHRLHNLTAVVRLIQSSTVCRSVQ